MKEYLKESIEQFEKKMFGTTTSPAKMFMFTVNPESKLLDVDRGKRFHSTVTKFLYVSNRARVDLKFSIAFLTTRVSKSTIQDW